MTGVLALACLITGLVTGWLLRTVFVMAEISRSQERMQRKLRYSQSQTARARFFAEQFAAQLAALGGLLPEAGEWLRKDGSKS